MAAWSCPERRHPAQRWAHGAVRPAGCRSRRVRPLALDLHDYKYL